MKNSITDVPSKRNHQERREQLGKCRRIERPKKPLSWLLRDFRFDEGDEGKKGKESDTASLSKCWSSEDFFHERTTTWHIWLLGELSGFYLSLSCSMCNNILPCQNRLKVPCWRRESAMILRFTSQLVIRIAHNFCCKQHLLRLAASLLHYWRMDR